MNSANFFLAVPDAEEIPPTVIEPNRSGVASGLRALWQYRDLLYFLTWRDIKVRYKQTLLGALWAILQPLMAMMVFSLLFGKLARIPSDNIPYPLFAYAGLMPWMFFSNAIANSGNSLVGSTNLITKVYFPRMIIPGAAVLAGLVDFGMAAGIFALFLIWYRVPVSGSLLMVPVLVVGLSTLALGVGMWLSALNVKYRDIRYAIPFLIQLWMFLTPVIYPASIMPGRYRLIYSLNPLTGIIEGFRAALLGGVNGVGFDWLSMSLAGGIAIGTFVCGIRGFRKMERSFADVI